MKIPDKILQVLSSSTFAGNTLTLPGQLDRNVYMQVDKVLKAAGGKWNRHTKCHVFDTAAVAAIEPVLLTGEIARPQDFGCFFSPRAVVDQVLKIAELKAHHKALEPSAGIGNIAMPLAFVVKELTCVELLPANVAKLRRNTPDRVEVIAGDFLELEPRRKQYDRVVMNPPFSDQADIDHVTRAVEYLKPGGVLVSVMSAGVTFREDRKARTFRELVKQHDGNIFPLPENSFSEVGTNVNTVIVELVA